MYQVGSLIMFKPDDPEIEDYWEAIERAEALSIDDGLYGVWKGQMEGSELLAIAYSREIFIK